MQKFLYWCNECDWEEGMNEHKYDFCPKCGHINIGRKTVKHMTIKEKMELKWEEMTAIKNERESLFDDFEANKERIAELHFEVEIKQLQYMFLKREQLAELKLNEKAAIVLESATNVESINDTCIRLVQKRLIEYGFEERLKQEGLL